MKLKLACVLVITLSLFMLSSEGQGLVKKTKEPSRMAKFMSLVKAKRCEPQPFHSLHAVKKTLEQDAVNMNPVVVSKVLTTLKCARANHTYHNHILTVIDYSLPSNQKRL